MKKLSEYEKQQNKDRRKALKQLEKMLKDKTIPFHYDSTMEIGDIMNDGRVVTTKHKIILEWKSFNKDPNWKIPRGH